MNLLPKGDSRKRLSANIYLNYIYSFLFFSDLTRGIWMIFLAFRGFSLIQLGIFESVFHVTSLVMEVPTGAVADLWGRKASRLAGRLFFLASLLFMFFSRSFSLQLIGFVLCAVNYNLESGSGEALLYDSMKILGRENAYLRVKGRLEFVIQTASVTAFLAGGYLAVNHVEINFLGTAVLVLAALIVGIFFTEPPFMEKRSKKGQEEKKEVSERIPGAATLIKQTFLSLGVIRKRPRIAFLILCSEVPFVFATTAFFYLQNFWKNGGRTEFYIGVVFALQCSVAGVTSLLASKVDARLGERRLLLLAPVLVAGCMWGIALTPVPALFFICSGFFEGLLLVSVSGYINRLIPSAYRATVLSFQSMVFSLMMIMMFPLVGFIGQHKSLQDGFLFMALVSTAAAGAFFYASRPGKV